MIYTSIIKAKKRRVNDNQNKQRKEKIKIRITNETEHKKIREKSLKAKSCFKDQ